MKSGNLAVNILKKVIVVFFMLVVTAFVIKGATKAYFFGYAVFMDEAVDTEENAREVTVTISEGESVLDIGKMLQRRGIINNAYVFFVQSYCYEDGRNLKPGSYNLTTNMNAQTIMSTIVSQSSQSETLE